MAARPQQLIASGDFDENRHAPAGRDGHANERDFQAEDFVELIVEPQALVFATRLPALELYDQLDALRQAGRRDPEQVLDVDHAEAPQFHVIARQLGTGADQNGFGAAATLHRIVAHEPVRAHNQVQRALALADAALADDQHAEAEDVHQHRVHHRPLGEGVLENRRQLRDRGRSGHGRLEQRPPGAFGFDEELRRRLESAGDDDARDINGQREAERRRARWCREAFEVPDFAFAEDEDAAGFEVLMKSRQGQAGLLDVRARDHARQAVDAGQQLEREAGGLGPAAEQHTDAYAWNGRH